MTKIEKNFTAEKIFLIFLNRKLQCKVPYLSLGLHKERPSYRRTLLLSKENIQAPVLFKTWNFLIFSTFVGRFSLLDPDPEPCLKGYLDQCITWVASSSSLLSSSCCSRDWRCSVRKGTLKNLCRNFRPNPFRRLVSPQRTLGLNRYFKMLSEEIFHK